MRMRIFILLVVVFVGVGSARADLIWDSGYREYSAGDEQWVYMYNDASVDITGGNIDELYMYDDTSAKITGGEVGIIWGQGNSSIEVYEGGAVTLLRPHDSSIATIYGGEIYLLFVLGNSTTKIYGGDFLAGGISVQDSASAIIEMHVQEYSWNANPDFGVLTGKWYESGEAFSIDYVALDAFDHMVFVPEPSMILLLGVGSLMLRYKK